MHVNISPESEYFIIKVMHINILPERKTEIKDFAQISQSRLRAFLDVDGVRAFLGANGIIGFNP